MYQWWCISVCHKFLGYSLIHRRPTGGPSTELWDFGSPPRATVPWHFMAFHGISVKNSMSGFRISKGAGFRSCLFNPQVAHRKIAGEHEEECHGLHFLNIVLHRHVSPGAIIKSSTSTYCLPQFDLVNAGRNTNQSYSVTNPHLRLKSDWVGLQRKGSGSSQFFWRPKATDLRTAASTPRNTFPPQALSCCCVLVLDTEQN